MGGASDRGLRFACPRLYSVAPSGLEGGSAAMAQETRGTHGAHETKGTRHTRFTRNKRYKQASTCERSLFIAEEDLCTCQKGGEGHREDCPPGRLPMMNDELSIPWICAHGSLCPLV